MTWWNRFHAWANPPTCKHRWRLIIEHYPTFAKDYWHCTRCGKAQAFEFDQPPAKVVAVICSVGDVHNLDAGMAKLVASKNNSTNLEN